MSFSLQSLTLVWMLLMGFAGLAGSGLIAGPWLIPLIAAALVMPALIAGLTQKGARSDSSTAVAPAGHPVGAQKLTAGR
jgi:hypothetical protein